MADVITPRLSLMYPNGQDQIKLLSYFAENPEQRHTFVTLINNEKALKQFTDYCLESINRKSGDSSSNLWEYITNIWKTGKPQEPKKVIISTCAGGITGAVTFGIWGAAVGAFVGNMAAEASSRYYSSTEAVPQEILEAYAFLSLPPTATNEEVEKAYREKSRLYHPDKSGTTELQTKLNYYVDKIRKFRGDALNHEDFHVV